MMISKTQLFFLLFLMVNSLNVLGSGDLRYEDVFTKDIYDQDLQSMGVKYLCHKEGVSQEEVKTALGLLPAPQEPSTSTSQTIESQTDQLRASFETFKKEFYQMEDDAFLNQAILEELRENKQNAIRSKSMEMLKQRRSILEKYQPGIGESFWKAGKKLVNRWAPLGKVLTDVAQEGFNAYKGEIPSPDPKQLAAELTRFESKIQDLLHRVENESFQALEEKYVLMKRFMTNHQLRAAIEKGFLTLRRLSTPAILEFLETALELPLEVKSLLPSDSNEYKTALRALMGRFNDDPFFSGFEEELREELLKVIVDTAINSKLSRDSLLTKRGCYYFWGNPGVGKSAAAREIPKFLGLPSYEKWVHTPDDINEVSIEGREWFNSNADQGILLKTFLQEVDGRKYRNTILIINDLDRILLGKKKGGNALSFLLRLLDLLNREIYSRYLTANLPIDYLTIIITANKPIPGGNGEMDDVYAALRERATQIHFPSLPSEKVGEILKFHGDSLVKAYHLNPEDATSLVEKALPQDRSSSIRVQKEMMRREAIKIQMRRLRDPEYGKLVNNQSWMDWLCAKL